MKYKDVDLRELFQVMHEFDVTEVTLNDGKTVVEVKRKLENQAVYLKESSPIAVPRVSIIQGNDREQLDPNIDLTAASTPKNEPSPAPCEDYHLAKAPLVGTFYRASSPDVEPFVEVGDRVNKGDVLCIVEAMKSMNEIQSEVGGIVKEICVENAQLVEFEQALFKIDTKG